MFRNHFGRRAGDEKVKSVVGFMCGAVDVLFEVKRIKKRKKSLSIRGRSIVDMNVKVASNQNFSGRGNKIG